MIKDVMTEIEQLGLLQQWDDLYGDHKKVVSDLTKTIFRGNNLWRLQTRLNFVDAWMIDRIVLRHQLLNYLVDEGHIYKQNLVGSVLDLGSFVGCSMDSLAMFGGRVQGTDVGNFANWSPSGTEIDTEEGIRYLEIALEYNRTPNLVTCFNADWVESMSKAEWCVKLYDLCMENLGLGGQVLLSFGERYAYEDTLLQRGAVKVYIPPKLREMEKEFMIGTVPK